MARFLVLATAHGAGSYFAVKSSYSANYAQVNGQGHKYIIQARVITGEWCKSSPQMKATPYKPNSPQQYECAVDDVNNPTIYVVFEDAYAYPDYIIKFQ